MALYKHDVIVVGSGLAGLRAALELAKSGLDVAIVSKVYPVRSHSCAAQGGINAALNPEDSIESHEFDTVKGSDYLGDQDAIAVFAKESPECVIELENMGVAFNRHPDGRIGSRPFGGASYPRACFIADVTGQAILHVLFEQILKFKVKVYEEYWVSSLIVEDSHCQGLICIEIKNQNMHIMQAKSVILAAGGLGQVFCPTSNALVCTGDGMSLAYKAGTPLMDMEMIQFHPTTLKNSGILLTEGCRGEGGHLLNKDGERFMSKSAPNKMELASRDVVSRAEQIEILEGRGIDGCVLLDLRHLGAERITKKLGQVRQLALVFTGLDMIKEPIPIRPGMHYAMGGVKTNFDGATYIPGLYSAGENACVTIHGANRLGGNSLMEGVVFGRRTGRSVSEYVKNLNRNFKSLSEIYMEKDKIKIKKLLERPDKGIFPAKLHRELGELMVSNVGVFRKEDKLKEAIDKIADIKERYKDVSVVDKSRSFNTNLIAAMELEGMILIAESIADSAYYRKESRGAHSRTDYTKRDDKNWMFHILNYYTPNGPKRKHLPVTFTKWEPQERKY